MGKENRLHNYIVGLVFLGGLALLGGATLQIRGFNLGEAMALSVRFPSVDNLKQGEDIVVFGHPIGEVLHIELDPEASPEDGQIMVECRLRQPIKLTDKSEFLVRSAGPLGGHYIEILPRPEGETRQSDWDGFRGKAAGDIFDELRELVADTRSGRGLLPRLINDEQLALKAEQTLDTIREAFVSLNADEGPLLAFEEIRKTFRNINEGEGPLNSFINDPTMRESLISTVNDLSAILKDARESQGIFNMLIRDTQARDDLKVTLERIKTSVEDLSTNKGLLGRLLRDEKLSAQVDEILTDVHDIVHKANTGTGTLGQIINNQEAWDELVRLLVLARESIEDFREQAPINTFANVLFSVF
ncbi:MAG: MlaD family protein [Planctomycetota bacterium]|nr:MlaD family protein [Planctomycetota bacterium]